MIIYYNFQHLLLMSKFIFRSPLLKLQDVQQTDESLISEYKKDKIKFAIYAASKDLYKELEDFEKGEKKNEKVLLSLYKYYSRMCTRSTPFGYFSGINVGEFGEKSEIIFGDKLNPKLRLDMDYLCNLYYELTKDTSLYPKLTFYANDTLYKVHTQWRYVEHQIRNLTRIHNLVSVDDNEVLSYIILEAKKGICFAQLSRAIIEFGFSEEEAEEYLFELINCQVLVSSIYPTVTGREYQHILFSELEKTHDPRFLDIDKKISSILSSDNDIITITNSLLNILKVFNTEINVNHLIQIDLLKEVKKCTLDATIKTEIDEATNVLASLLPQNLGNEIFDKFTTAFYEQYENSFVSLSLIMDSDIGLGYKKAISNFWKSKFGFKSECDNIVNDLKLKLYLESIKQNKTTVELKDSHLNLIKKITNKRILPNSYGFIGKLLNDDKGQPRVLYKNVGGPSAINLIGRFGHLDEEINLMCKNLAEAEQETLPDVILAEIAHLSQGRLGNVLTRPHYRKFEIKYLCNSTLPEEQQITTDDLYIGIRDSRLILFSKRLNKEIVPRLSNAHNYSNDSLPIYHFLCDLQSQGLTPNVYWTWGTLESQEFLPRVTYKRIILSPARWNIDTTDLKKVGISTSEDALRDYFNNKNIPNEFVIDQGDNELYIDIRTSLGRKTFLNFCKKYKKLNIEEFLFKPANTWDGFVGEIIVPFKNENPQNHSILTSVKFVDSAFRTFTPFSKWVYFKFYMGLKISNNFLIDIITPLSIKLKQENIIIKWFFIRYSDSKNHLRVRFELESLKEREGLYSIISEAISKFVEEGLIKDIQIGTYQREIERYGFETIEETEEWFCHNSNMVIKLLPLIMNSAERDRVAYAMLYIDQLFNHFKLPVLEKKNLCEKNSGVYKTKLAEGSHKGKKVRLDNEYRKCRGFIEDVMIFNSNNLDSDLLKDIRLILATSLEMEANIIKTIIRKCEIAEMDTLNIISSFVHMFINRMFESEQRKIETATYYFLAKFYNSLVARDKFMAVE